MAQFRGTVGGNRGAASRLGTKSSGLTTTCNGWDDGVTVHAHYDEEEGEDVFEIYVTGGSNGRKGDRHLATVRAGETTVSPSTFWTRGKHE